MPPLSDADVIRIARLARLDLTGLERHRLAQELSAILDYAGQLTRVATAGPESSLNPGVRQLPERPDDPVPGLHRNEALQNAPDADLEAGLFRVPRVLGG